MHIMYIPKAPDFRMVAELGLPDMCTMTSLATRKAVSHHIAFIVAAATNLNMKSSSSSRGRGTSRGASRAAYHTAEHTRADTTAHTAKKPTATNCTYTITGNLAPTSGALAHSVPQGRRHTHTHTHTATLPSQT